uniref:Uncharacterized protein n=1 Tax=Rhipicephalus appendiculatus TaxID=34631 RepID=A0A131YAI4_RHIAP
MWTLLFRSWVSPWRIMFDCLDFFTHSFPYAEQICNLTCCTCLILSTSEKGLVAFNLLEQFFPFCQTIVQIFKAKIVFLALDCFSRTDLTNAANFIFTHNLILI